MNSCDGVGLVCVCLSALCAAVEADVKVDPAVADDEEGWAWSTFELELELEEKLEPDAPCVANEG